MPTGPPLGSVSHCLVSCAARVVSSLGQLPFDAHNSVLGNCLVELPLKLFHQAIALVLNLILPDKEFTALLVPLTKPYSSNSEF